MLSKNVKVSSGNLETALCKVCLFLHYFSLEKIRPIEVVQNILQIQEAFENHI